MNDTHTFGFALDPSDAWHRVPSHVRDTGMYSNLLLPTQTSSSQNSTFDPQPLNRTMLHASAFGILMDDAIKRHAIANIEGSDGDVS